MALNTNILLLFKVRKGLWWQRYLLTLAVWRWRCRSSITLQRQQGAELHFSSSNQATEVFQTETKRAQRNPCARRPATRLDDATTLSTGAESQKDSQAGESDAQNLAQSNGLQSASEQPGQIQQFQIVGHPILQQIQIQSPQQQVVQGSIQTLQPVQQNLQLQAFQNPTQVLIRTPTLTPSGQISWQTVQVQNAGMPQQLTLAPMGSGSSGGTFTQIAPLTLGGSPITLSAAQLPAGTGVQTVNIAGLGAAGVQVQGVPLTITGMQGKPLPPVMWHLLISVCENRGQLSSWIIQRFMWN